MYFVTNNHSLFKNPGELKTTFLKNALESLRNCTSPKAKEEKMH